MYFLCRSGTGEALSDPQLLPATSGAPVRPSACTGFCIVPTIKHLDSLTAAPGKLGLVCSVLVSDLEVSLYEAFCPSVLLRFLRQKKKMNNWDIYLFIFPILGSSFFSFTVCHGGSKDIFATCKGSWITNFGWEGHDVVHSKYNQVADEWVHAQFNGCLAHRFTV